MLFETLPKKCEKKLGTLSSHTMINCETLNNGLHYFTLKKYLCFCMVCRINLVFFTQKKRTIIKVLRKVCSMYNCTICKLVSNTTQFEKKNCSIEFDEHACVHI